MDRIPPQQVLLMSSVLSLGTVAIWAFLNQRGCKTGSLRDALVSFLRSGLHHCSRILIGVGLLSMLSAALLQMAVRREGLLQSEELYTVRMPQGFEVAHLSTANHVATGDVIATFRSPERQAEYEVLQLRCKSLKTEQDIMEREPVNPDAKLVQRLQELDAEHRHLRAALEHYTIEHREVQRQRTRDIQAKQAEIIDLRGVLNQLPQERLQSEAELKYKSWRLLQAKSMRSQKALSEQEYREISKQVSTISAEVEKLKAKEESARQQKAQAEQDVRELDTLMQQQTIRFDQELAGLREQLEKVTRQRSQLRSQLDHDLARAKEQKLGKLEQIRLKLAQIRNTLTGLKRMLEVTAPMSGRVVYRNPSPGTVYSNDPLLVIAPPDALRFRVRLPIAQAKAIRAADAVSLELNRRLRKGDDLEMPAQHLVRRFHGQPLSIRTMEDDPNMMLVELTCSPPDDAVRDLALGEAVRADLLWIPPLFTLPLFAFGAVPVGIGVVGVSIARTRRGMIPESSELNYEPPPANACLRKANPDAASLRLLGEQLGEMIRAEELDPSLLATCEWTIDRHGVGGGRLLARGLRESGPIAEGLQRLTDRASGDGSPFDRDVSSGSMLLERLVSLLRVIAPDEVPQRPTLALTEPER